MKKEASKQMQIRSGKCLFPLATIIRERPAPITNKKLLTEKCKEF